MIVVSIFALAATGCGSTGAYYQPITDGPVSYGYSVDLEQCRQVAERKNYLNDETKLAGVTGAVIGAAVGSLESSEDALVGAVAGGLLGTSEGALQAHQDRKQIVISCMQGRGHKVVG